MKHLSIIFVLMCFAWHTLPLQAQFPDVIKEHITVSKSQLSASEAAEGIKEALVKGTERAVSLVSKEDGYFRNPDIKIPFPPDAKQMEQKLRAIGLGTQVDEAILSFNRAAENAAKEIQPIFIAAIKQLTIQDAIDIIEGEKNAATNYLEETTSSELYEKIKPVIEKSLDEVNATKYWTDLIKSYNAIPFVKKMNPDLADYVADEAIGGLFVMVAREEEKIRTDPVARTTEILQKVFGQ